MNSIDGGGRRSRRKFPSSEEGGPLTVAEAVVEFAKAW